MRGRTVVGAVLGAVLALGGAVAPAAAASPIEFSRDGSSWASSLSGSLFGDYLLVPRDSVTREFFIRNTAAEAGYLRITLRDVTTDNLDFAGALGVRADLAGWPGEVVAVSTARPCARLTEGPVISSGETVRVGLTALLGDLEGERGQNGSAGFQIVVSLSGQPLGLGATGCPTSGAEIAGFSPVTTRPGGVYRGGVPFFWSSTSTGWMRTPWTPGETTVTDPTTTTPVVPSLPTTRSIRVVSNTDRFYQEYDVALWLLAALLGAAAAWIVLRRRPRAVPEDGPDPNGAPR